MGGKKTKQKKNNNKNKEKEWKLFKKIHVSNSPLLFPKNKNKKKKNKKK
jgi:hypothetical protein